MNRKKPGRHALAKSRRLVESTEMRHPETPDYVSHLIPCEGSRRVPVDVIVQVVERECRCSGEDEWRQFWGILIGRNFYVFDGPAEAVHWAVRIQQGKLSPDILVPIAEHRSICHSTWTVTIETEDEDLARLAAETAKREDWGRVRVA